METDNKYFVYNWTCGMRDLEPNIRIVVMRTNYHSSAKVVAISKAPLKILAEHTTALYGFRVIRLLNQSKQ